MTSLPPEIANKIEFLSSSQFKNRISVTSIINWLGNFESAEIPVALKILEKTEYFTVTDLSTILESNLRDFLNRNIFISKTLHFIPLGEAGKSGHIISYLVKNLLKNGHAKGLGVEFHNSISELLSLELSEKDIVIYLDDIIGSGNTFLKIACDKKTLNKIYKINAAKDGIATELFNGNPHHTNILLSCIIMSHGLERIKKQFPQLTVWGEIREKAFHKTKSPFHSYKTVLLTRELSYRYGSTLVKDKHDSLGFGNSQSLILFDHATPNNTIPILWVANDRWTTLLSRSHTERVNYNRLNRDLNNRWLIKLSELFGISQYQLSDSDLFSQKNYALAYILRLRCQNWSDIEIAREMSITLDELLQYRKEGENLNLWDQSFNPSSFAIDRIKEVQKSIRFTKEEEPPSDFDDCDILYVPDTFEGQS